MGGHGGLNIFPRRVGMFTTTTIERESGATGSRRQGRADQARAIPETRYRVTGREAPPGPAQSDEKPSSPSAQPDSIAELSKSEIVTEPFKSESDSKHINLFEGVRIFDPIKAVEGKGDEKKKGKFASDDNKRTKKVKMDEVRTVGPEDEVYRLG